MAFCDIINSNHLSYILKILQLLFFIHMKLKYNLSIFVLSCSLFKAIHFELFETIASYKIYFYVLCEYCALHNLTNVYVPHHILASLTMVSDHCSAILFPKIECTMFTVHLALCTICVLLSVSTFWMIAWSSLIWQSRMAQFSVLCANQSQPTPGFFLSV